MSNNQPSCQLTELSDGSLVCEYRKTDLIFSGNSVKTLFQFECYNTKWEVILQSADCISSVKNLLASICCRELKSMVRAKIYLTVSQKTYVDDSQISLKTDFKRISDTVSGSVELRPTSSGIQRNLPFEIHVRVKLVPEEFLAHIFVRQYDEQSDANASADVNSSASVIGANVTAISKVLAVENAAVKSERETQIEGGCKSNNENVRLICGDATAYANKAELMQHSAVFRSMFQGHFTESSNNQVLISDTHIDALRVFLAYATTLHDSLIADGDPTFLKFGVDIFVLSDKYQVMTLRERCVSWLWNNLTVDSCIDLLIACHEHDERRLKARCVSFVAKRCNVEGVFCTDAWLRLCSNVRHSEVRQVVDIAVAQKLARSVKRPLVR